MARTSTRHNHQRRLGVAVAASAMVLSFAACGGGTSDELTVGSCLQFERTAGTSTSGSGGSITVSHKVVDCNLSGEFKVQVTEINPADDCLPDYVQYGSSEVQYCLAPVLEVDHCYAPDDIYEWIDMDCDNPDVYFRIEKELAGTDTAECTDKTGHFELPVPAPGKIYCTVAP